LLGVNVKVKREDHHLFHDRISWESRDTAKLIRRNRGLIVPLEHDTHKELHIATPVVPLLGYFALYRVARDFQGEPRNYLGNIEEVQRAIEEAGKSPKAHYVERQVGELAIHVLELQKPFIKEDYQ
jgi:hypothetical protein